MNPSIRPIGVHVRLYQGLSDIITAVDTLSLCVVQSFLMTEALVPLILTDHEAQAFVRAKRKTGFDYFVHAAYWSGLTDVTSRMFVSLEQEVAVANRLHADGVVVHCGPRKGRSVQDQARYVAESINTLHALYATKLLLENTPHAGKSFGGNLQDLALVAQHVEKKELLGFCIDTAHAFVYGYDIVHEKDRNDFLAQIKDDLGVDKIALLHFNDAQDLCGSHIDKHQIPGRGLIGHKALASIMHDPLFAQVPIILELPGMCDESERLIIDQISSW